MKILQLIFLLALTTGISVVLIYIIGVSNLCKYVYVYMIIVHSVIYGDDY